MKLPRIGTGAANPVRVTRLNEPVPIRTSVADDGRIRGVRLRETWHRVVQVLDYWIIEDGWWRESSLVSRAYRSLLLEDGRQVTVYEDLAAGTWFQQRY